MAEYIKRIDTFSDKMCEGIDCGVCPFYNKAGENDCQVVAFLRSIPAADVRPVKWIPVTERLPEEYTDVLCYYEYFRYGDYNCMFRTIDRGYYGNGRWGGEAGQGHKNKVLAWMPLPEPPKEESYGV